MDETVDSPEDSAQATTEAAKQKKPEVVEGPFADTRRQRSTEEIVDIANKMAKEQGEEIPEEEAPLEQKIRHGKKYEAALQAQRGKPKEPTPAEETVAKPETETPKLNDVFFRDYVTGSPERLHRTIEGKVKGEKDTEPVILPQIPDNWIIKVAVGLGGAEAHYRLSNPKDTEEANKRLGLGTITSTDRGIIIMDAVHKDEVADLVSQGNEVVAIDQVQEKLESQQTTAREPALEKAA